MSTFTHEMRVCHVPNGVEVRYGKLVGFFYSSAKDTYRYFRAISGEERFVGRYERVGVMTSTWKLHLAVASNRDGSYFQDAVRRYVGEAVKA